MVVVVRGGGCSARGGGMVHIWQRWCDVVSIMVATRLTVVMVIVVAVVVVVGHRDCVVGSVTILL